MSRRLALVVLLLGVAVTACRGASTPGEKPGDVSEQLPVLPVASSEASRSNPSPEPSPAPVVVEQAPVAKKVVILDPGHGGDEVGAARNGVVEKDSNLDMALRVEQILLAHGVDVALTRRSDSRAAPQVPGFTAARSDLQARLDLANAAGGDVFVSIHSNGSEDASQRGVEAWFDSNRPFAAEGRELARLLVANVLSELRSYGYVGVDHGLFDGKCFRERAGRCFTLFVIGGPRETAREEVIRRGGDPEALGFNGGAVTYSRPADMPAALVELLIITNPADAAILRLEGGRNAMARGVARAILEFLGLLDGGI